jgi:hypothetical protein
MHEIMAAGLGCLLCVVSFIPIVWCLSPTVRAECQRSQVLKCGCCRQQPYRKPPKPAIQWSDEDGQETRQNTAQNRSYIPVSDRERRAIAAETRRAEYLFRRTEVVSRAEKQAPRAEAAEGRRVVFASREMGPGCEYSTRQMIEPPFPYELPPIAGILK